MRALAKYIMGLVLSIVSVSCVFDADECLIPNDSPRGITFSLSLETRRSRSTWGEDYPKEEGVPFDYRIKKDQVSMLILAEDGTPVGKVEDLDVWASNEAHTTFQFYGQLPQEFVEYANTHGDVQKYKFMVIANCDADISNVENATYKHTALNPNDETAAIPMWGVTEANVSALYTQENVDLGEIWLLRAAAKVEVSLSDALKDKAVTIHSATLKYYNQTGYVLPNEWWAVSNTKEIKQEECIRNYRHAAVNMPLVKDESTGNYYIYVTEYDNINYADERNKISIAFNINGTIKRFEDAISFCQYEDGAPKADSHYNIVRNHIYEFEVLSIAGSNLTLEYEVADWTTEDWDGTGKEYEEHDLSYPTYHNPVVPYDFLSLSATDQANYVIAKAPEMYYTPGNPEDGGFHCYFQILAPADVEWNPIFTGSKENYRVRVYRVDKNLVQDPTPIYDTGEVGKQGNLGACGAGEWFHIVVFPLSNDGADHTTIDFGISYYQNWTDQYINLYVNGEYDNIKWPNSGNNPKIINIKHTSAI